MKLVLIVFYFGPFPEYFSLFLEACRWNPSVDWLLLTDQSQPVECPENVHWQQLSFTQCRVMIQSRFSFTICLDRPKKLCDYKPAYGYILAEQLGAYDFWGHCDLDQIFGKLESFVTRELLADYDKLFTLGHLSLYRNTPECSRWFMDFDGGVRCRQVLQSSEILAFDEWGADGINEIYRRADSPFRFYSEAIGADVWPERDGFCLSERTQGKNRYHPVRNSDCIFLWQAGHLWQLTADGCRKEYPYVHLQMRNLPLHLTAAELQAGYYILPSGFYPVSIGQEQAMKLGKRRLLPGGQFLKLKWRNLKHRLSGC